MDADQVIQGQFPSEEAFKQMLASRKTTVDQMRADIRQDMASRTIENELSGKVAVAERATDFYAKNPDQFTARARARGPHPHHVSQG